MESQIDSRAPGSEPHKIATRLEECLHAGYFDDAIRGTYALICHVRFLEGQVASLKETIARLQDEDQRDD